MLGKVITGKGVSLPAQSPLVSAYVTKKEPPLPKPTAHANALIVLP